MMCLFMFFWMGELQPRGVSTYLNGFLLQLGDDSMRLYYREGVKDVPYPHRWKP